MAQGSKARCTAALASFAKSFERIASSAPTVEFYVVGKILAALRTPYARRVSDAALLVCAGHGLDLERNRDLLDLALWIGNLPHQNVTRHVDTSFCVGVQHASSLELLECCGRRREHLHLSYDNFVQVLQALTLRQFHASCRRPQTNGIGFGDPLFHADLVTV